MVLVHADHVEAEALGRHELVEVLVVERVAARRIVEACWAGRARPTRVAARSRRAGGATASGGSRRIASGSGLDFHTLARAGGVERYVSQGLTPSRKSSTSSAKRSGCSNGGRWPQPSEDLEPRPRDPASVGLAEARGIPDPRGPRRPGSARRSAEPAGELPELVRPGSTAAARRLPGRGAPSRAARAAACRG